MSKRDDLPFTLTLHVRDHCLCLHVRRAARALARRYDEALRPVGLTNGQFSLLMSLNQPGPAAITAVADLLALDRTTLTANLKPLERRGLVQVLVDAKDKRSRRLLLTDAGRKVLREAVPIWKRTNEEDEMRLAGLDSAQFRAALAALA
jgi:DNA-binding MarR family transcriptional regulator